VDGYAGAVTVEASNPTSLRDGIVAAADLVGTVYEDPHSWDQTAAAFEDVFARLDSR
jgi:hypothetical protein